jgi:outer membrane receptor protein involved in Fe transport
MMTSRLLCSVSAVAVAVHALGSGGEARAQEPAATQPPLPAVTVSAPQRRAPQPARRAAPRPAPQPQPALPAPVPTEPTRSDLSTAASAQPAASSTIDYRTISQLPVNSYGDMFRPLPGFYVSNYGQGAIGYGIGLRGFTEAEHGRDIAVSVDGMPLNEVSSLHTPNYVDLNPLIPETVKSIEVIRGPFSVEYGDSNLGGSIKILTKRSEPFASLTGEGGSYGTLRGLATYSRTGGTFEPYLVLEGYRTDGYRDNSFINRFNSFNKVSLPVADGVLSLRAQAYGTTSGAASYINRDAVLAGTLSPKTAVNQTDGTDRTMQNFVANYVTGVPDQELSSTLYVNHFDHARYSDFGGGQRVQKDDRTYMGGTVRKVWTGSAFDTLPMQFLVGGNWRTDFIDTYQARTVSRVETVRTLDVGVDQTNLAGFAQLQVKPVQWLKLTGGTRYDHFFYDVENKLVVNQFNTDVGVWSPKAGISVTPISWLELYGNYGEGFRSPDAPLELLSNPNLEALKLKSKEVGVQFRFDRLTFLADVWRTDIANEVFQAAPGLPLQNLGRSKREGYELEGRYWYIKDRDNAAAFFVNFTDTRALLENGGPSIYVPNVPTWLLNVGTEFDVATWNGERLSGSAYITFVGKKFLSEDGLLTTAPYQRLNAKLVYSWPSNWSVFASAVWYPSDRTSEIAINFGPGVGATSADIFTAPQPGLTLMAGLTYRIPTTATVPLPTSKTVIK